MTEGVWRVSIVEQWGTPTLIGGDKAEKQTKDWEEVAIRAE